MKYIIIITISFVFILVVIILVLGLYFRFNNRSSTTTCSDNRSNVMTSGCHQHSDCPDNFICSSDNVCIPMGKCLNDQDCLSLGQVCVKGTCQQCEKDAQCPIGYLCSSGKCISRTCSTHKDCPDSSICINGLCSPKSCQDVRSCDSGEACMPVGDHGTKICIPVNKPCINKYDCFGGSLPCHNGLCRQCINSSDCPDDSFCMMGVCNNVCLNSSQCPSDKPFCIDGKCYSTPIGASCNSTLSCRNNNKYNLYCVNNMCSPTNGQLGDRCDSLSCSPELICNNICIPKKETAVPTTDPTIDPNMLHFNPFFVPPQYFRGLGFHPYT